MASSSGSAPPSGGNLTPNQAKPAKRSSSKLDILLMKLHNTADSSGASPDPVVSRSGSSRRKPKVIRKVTESEENDDNDDEYMDNGNDVEMNGKSSNSPDPGTMNGNTDGEENMMDSVTVDEEGNHVLPDGTMVVQPEPVLKGQFRGPEFSKSRNRNPKDLDKVMCTGCNKQLNPHIRNAVRRHPVLKVLICKKCYDWYTSDDIDQDSDGMDEQCRWCGEGGNLLCCDYCHNAFCKGCIKRNLGRAELSTVDDADEDAKWRCYVCNCKPLKKLVEHCNEVLQIIEEEHNKRGGGDCDSRSDKGKTKGKGKNSAQKSGPSTSVFRGKGPATPNAPAFQQSSDFEISADKTKPVLNRLTAVTTSFQMFLSSLESDYKNHAKKKEIEEEVSKKLKRAMLSYKKLFAEIETFARGGSNQSKSSPQVKRINSQRGETKQQHARAASSSSSKDSKVKTDRLSLPKKTTEVIELSSEDDSKEEQKPSTKKTIDVKDSSEKTGSNSQTVAVMGEKAKVKASSEKTSSSSETGIMKGENGVFNIDEPKVEADLDKTDELIVQTESESSILKISNVVSETMEALPEESITKESEETKMEVDSEEKTDPDATKEDRLKQNEEPAEEKEVANEAVMEVTSAEPAERTEDNAENNPDKTVELDAETQQEVIGDDLPSADKDVEDYNQGDFISVYRAALDAEVNKDSQVDEDEAIEERVAEVEDDLDSEDDAPLVDRKSKSAKKTKTLSKKGEKSKAQDSDSDDEDDDKTSSARRKGKSQAGGSKKGPPRRPANKRKGDDSSDSSSEDSNKRRNSPKTKAKKVENASDKEDKTSRLKLKDKKEKETVVNLDSDSEDERPPKKETTTKNKETTTKNKETTTKNKEHSVSDSDDEEPKKSKQTTKSKPEEKAKVKKAESDSDDEPEEKIRKSSRPKAKEEAMCISDSEEDAPTPKGKGNGKGKSSRKDDDSDGRKSPKGKGKGKSSVKKSLDFLDAEEKASPIKSGGRSREDIEAQRKLHQEMLVGDSSDSDDEKKSDSESDPLEDTSHSSSSEEEKGSDYDPSAERKNKKMSRIESAKKKSKDKFKALIEKREKKKRREKVEKERATRRKKRKDDSSDESDDDEPAKSKSKKKAQVAKSKAKKKTFFDDLDDSDTAKGKKSKKSKKAKDAASDSSDDDKKPAKKKKSKKEEESDSSADSDLDKDIAKLSASLKTTTTKKKTKKDGEVDKEVKKPAKKKAGKKSKDTDSDSSSDDKKPKKKKKNQGSDVDSEDNASKKKSSKEKKKNPEKDSSDDFDSDSETNKKAAAKKETKSSKEGKDKDSETDDKSKVKKERKLKAEKVEKEESDSSADSELDKDIAKLAALPLKMTIQKKTKKDGQVDYETKKKKKEAGPDKSPRLARKERAKKKGIDIDELSGSDSASDGKDEPDDVMLITLNSDEEEEQLMKLKAVAEKDEADKKARKALLASDSDSDLSANSSDDEDDDEGGKKKKKKDKDDGTSDSSDLKTKSKKKRKTTALLNTKLSDSDASDVDEKKKKKSNGKKKGSDDEFELDDEDEDLEAIEDEDDDDDDDDDKAISIPSDSDESVGKKKKKKGKKADSDEEIDSEDGKKKKSYEKGKGKRKRKRIKAMSDSSPETEDSDAPKPKKKKRKKKKGSDDEEEEEEGSGEDGATPGKKRKNIKKLIKDKKLSQDTKQAAKDEEDRRKRITERQKLYNIVQEETETAGKKIMVTTKLVLESKKYEDEDGEEQEKALIEVHPEIINKLKPHQVEAVKFLWGCLVESLERLKSEDGAGCILAHCMGLGKTLSMISFIHTVLSNKKRTKQSTCIVVCPLNTVLNWEHEFEKWVPEDSPLDVYELTTVKDNWGRADRLKQWHDGGGILIMGYEMYRNLSQAKRVRNKKQKKIFAETLVDPGPDLVVCDEGHILKNDKSSTSIAMNGVRTKRRVVLTGTPLQNNLGEYHCMVSFVKPSLLGTRKEFSNRFVNPITNGQCANASKWDVKLMKKRAHILHETLNGCVQRKDYAALTKFLPPKHEYILSIRLSNVQCDLYQRYLDNVGRSGLLEKGDVRGASLFSDYQNLSRIWTHPWILKLHEVREQNKRTYDDEDSFVDDDSDDMDSFIDDSDDNSDDSNAKWGKKKNKKTRDSEEKEEKEAEPKAGTSSGKRGSDHDSEFEIVKKYKTRSRRDRDPGDPESEPEPEKESPLSREWWSEYVSEGDRYKLELSGKLFVLAEILKMSEAIGDKVLVFSQSLLSLDLIEDFLEHWDKTVPAENPEEQIAGQQSWSHGIDYFRMDGSTNSALRKKWSEIFNDAENPRARLFLISTKAGSLGTNMVGANRCIIFDASWNPTHDVQSIFRVYRFGQVKPVYIYRFLAQGTMEEKIYERQVTKQSLSSRVVDEHQIERHFTSESLQELYSFTPERLDDPNHKERPTPVLPKDRMLAEMITSLKDHIVGYHEHDSLLENQIDEELSEEDRKAAWEEYEAEKKGLIQRVAQPNYQQPRMQMNPYGYPMNHQPPQQMSMFPHLTEVARAIRNANPNVSMQELQQRLEHYMRLQMASQQQVLYQQQQQHMQQGVASLLTQAQVAGQQIPPGIRIIRAPAQVAGQQTAPGTRIIRVGARGQIPPGISILRAPYGVQQQMMQGGAGPEPGEVTFMGYGGKGGANSSADTGSALYSMLNGSKQPPE